MPDVELLQQNRSVLNQADLHNGHKTVAVVVLVYTQQY